MSEVQEYVRQGPRLLLLARHKALHDLCPAAETNTAHTAAAAAAAATDGHKDEAVGPPAPSVVVRGGAGASACGGALSPTAAPGSAPAFPPVPTLVGNKYLLTRPFDHSACHATNIHTGQSLLVKVSCCLTHSNFLPDTLGCTQYSIYRMFQLNNWQTVCPCYPPFTPLLPPNTWRCIKVVSVKKAFMM